MSQRCGVAGAQRKVRWKVKAGEGYGGAAEEAVEKAAKGTHFERASRGCLPEVDLAPLARLAVVDDWVPRRAVAQVRVQHGW